MGIGARGHTTSYRHAGTTLRRISSDVIMAVNGLNVRSCIGYKQKCQSLTCEQELHHDAMVFFVFPGLLRICVSIV